MLLIAYLSQILYSIMFAVVFKSPKFWIVFSCHQFINKSVASFYNFRYFFNLSFLYFLIKYFFILSVICSICFFSSLSYIKLFIGRRLDENILRLFWCGENIIDFFLGLRFDYSLHFIRLDFCINCAEFNIIKKGVGFILKKRKYGM